MEELDLFASAVLDSGVVDSIEDAKDFSSDCYISEEEYVFDAENAVKRLGENIIDYCRDVYDETVSKEKAIEKAESILSMIYEVKNS